MGSFRDADQPDRRGGNLSSVVAAGVGTKSGGSYRKAEAKGVGERAWDKLAAFSQAATEQIPFLDEAAAWTSSKITGVPYEEMRRHAKDLAETDRRENPGARNAGGIAGFLATLAAPGGRFIKGAKTMPEVVARSAAVGSGYGALAGAGAADDGERLEGAARGAGVGALAGAAVPAAVKAAQSIPGAIRRTGSGLSEASTRVAQQFGREAPEAVITPRSTDRAEEFVARMAAARGKAPADLAADPALALGKPVTSAEALGRTGVAQLTAIGRRSGRTADDLEAMLAARADEAGARVVDDFSSASGIDPATVADDFAAMNDVLRRAASPAYAKAYANKVALTDELNALMQRPSLKAAQQRAYAIAAEEGRDPRTLGLRVDTKPGIGFAGRNTAKAVRQPTGYSMQTLDYIKRGMDDIIEGYRDPTTRRLNLNTQGRAEAGTAAQFRQHLVEANPDYAEALAKGGEPLRLEQAWRDAPNLMSSRVSERTFAARWDKMGEAERQAHLGGFANDLFERARSGRLRLKDFRNPAFRKKLAMSMGPEQSLRFMGSLEQEVRLAKGGRMAPGTNSVTEEVRQASQELDRGTGFMADLQRRLDGGQGPLKAIPATVGSAVASPVAGFVRGVQAPMNQATRDEVGRLLMLPPDELAKILAGRPAPRAPGMFGTQAVPAVANYAAGQR